MLLAAASNGKELWYLTRGTGVVSLLLLSAGVVLGVAGSTRWRSTRWPRFLVAGLHRNVTLLAILFVAAHVATTVLDRFAPIGWLDAIVPFASSYRPVWLGLGTVAFDLLLALVATSMLRGRIGFKAWRYVHWLAYASWPVALMHTLGTGSDARTGWLQLLSLACTGAVVLAIVWRAVAARTGAPAIRLGAVVAALGVTVLLGGWATSGPLRTGWAARAGTPAKLLPVRATVSATRTVQPAQSGAVALPSGRFTVPVTGTITNKQDANGLVVITIDTRSRGSFKGRIHVALRGQPLAGGGVQMLDNVVGVLPVGAGAWDVGRVVGLQGQQILADVSERSGGTVRILLDLHIDANAGTVSGVLHGGLPRTNGDGE